MIVDSHVASITVSAVTGPAQTDNFEHPGSGYSLCSRSILATKPVRISRTVRSLTVLMYGLFIWLTESHADKLAYT